MTKIGLVGGYFDPIHNYHLFIGEWAIYRFGLDRVIYMTSGTPPHKGDKGLPRQDRFDMVAAAVAKYPKFEASRLEIDRPGVTWTIDTLRELQKIHPDARLHFVMGADNIKGFDGYQHRDEFFSLAKLLIAGRGVTEADPLKSWQERLPGADIGHLDVPLSDLSSTLVRDLIKQGAPYRSLVPAPVYDLIETAGYYRTKTSIVVPASVAPGESAPIEPATPTPDEVAVITPVAPSADETDKDKPSAVPKTDDSGATNPSQSAA